MKIKALKSFVGIVSMNIGEIKDVDSNEVGMDLVRSGLAIAVEDAPVKEAPKKAPAKKPAAKKAPARKTTKKTTK